MCNLFITARSASEVARWFRARSLRDLTGNMPWPEDVYPDRPAPIVTGDGADWAIETARWGMPTPPAFLKTARDPGVTNIRNTASPHWRRWLAPAHRCLVPLVRFSEPGPDHRPVWFEVATDEPAFLAGLHLRDWTSTRKVKDGPTTDHLFGFLTCPPNGVVAPIHPKAMPVILTDPADWETWMTAPWDVAQVLQRPLPDAALRRSDPEETAD